MIAGHVMTVMQFSNKGRSSVGQPSFFIAMIALLFIGSAAASELLTGVASVIDGDTLEVHGQRIRLLGIDAPESRQACVKDGKSWHCGNDAAFMLADKIDRKPVSCEPKGRHDRYGRVIAVCRQENEDLNAWMVRQGWAMAYQQYSKAYVAEEANARDARRGIWASEFAPPWEWRKQDRKRGNPRKHSSRLFEGFRREGYLPEIPSRGSPAEITSPTGFNNGVYTLPSTVGATRQWVKIKIARFSSNLQLREAPNN